MFVACLFQANFIDDDDDTVILSSDEEEKSKSKSKGKTPMKVIIKLELIRSETQNTKWGDKRDSVMGRKCVKMVEQYVHL